MSCIKFIVFLLWNPYYQKSKGRKFSHKSYFSTSKRSQKRVPLCSSLTIRSIFFFTYSPHIHRRSILSVSHQELWTPVPPGSHIISVVLSWTYHSGKTKVTQFYNTILKIFNRVKNFIKRYAIKRRLFIVIKWQ